jgi:hypothetical protein
MILMSCLSLNFTSEKYLFTRSYNARRTQAFNDPTLTAVELEDEKGMEDLKEL